jgi:hypothetical protein
MIYVKDILLKAVKIKPFLAFEYFNEYKNYEYSDDIINSIKNKEDLLR